MALVRSSHYAFETKSDSDQYQLGLTLNMLLTDDLLPRVQVVCVFVYHLTSSERFYCLGLLYALFAHEAVHPYLPTFLSILERSDSDQIEMIFVSMLVFSPTAPSTEVSHDTAHRDETHPRDPRDSSGNAQWISSTTYQRLPSLALQQRENH
jgi:hypothetical protein